MANGAKNEAVGADKLPDFKQSQKDKKDKQLSEADQKLKEDIALIFSRIKDSNEEVGLAALAQLKDMIITSSIMMATVPKSLKFVKPFYSELKNLQTSAINASVKTDLADIISSLSVIMGDPGDTLKYFMLGSKTLTENHSQEFVHHLVLNLFDFISNNLQENERISPDALEVIKMIVDFQVKHNGEIDACDFLINDELEMLQNFIEPSSLLKISEYLDRCATLMPENDKNHVLTSAITLNLKHENYPAALHAAIHLNDIHWIYRVIKSCTKKSTLYQMIFMLASLQINVDFEQLFGSEVDESILRIFSNTDKSKYFIESCKDLDILQPKSLTDIFKKSIDFPKLHESSDPIHGRKYLSYTIANNLVNCGFGSDTIFTTPDCQKWIENMSDFAMVSSIASTGYLYLWNIDDGLNFVNQFLTSDKPKVKAGGILAAGIIGTSIRDEFDSVCTLIKDEMESDDIICRISAALGLGITYAGTNLPMITNILLPHIHNSTVAKKNIDFVCTVSLSLGLISIGTANSDVSSYILQAMIVMCNETLSEKHCRIMALALGLVYTKQPAAGEVAIQALHVLTGPLKSTAIMMVVIMSYAGTGNVERILELIRCCMSADEDKSASATKTDQADESIESKNGDDANTDDKNDAETDESKTDSKIIDKLLHHKNRRLAVLGMVIVAMGDKVGSEMMLRLISQLSRYGDYKVKSAIPLAIALLNISNPNLSTLHMLAKSTHEFDNFISITSMIALGLVSAGTNNAKYSQMMKQLKSTSAAQKDSVISYVLNQSLGLCYLGKGSMTLSPLMHDNRILKLTSLGSIVSFAIMALNHDDYIHGKQNYMWHLLAPAIRCKFLNTYNSETLEKQPIKVRVGAPVDTVSHAGKQRRVTGFQTHSTPVAISADERAEIVSDEISALTPFIEGNVVIECSGVEKMEIE